MGQATVDLPDPLEPALAPSTPTGADDLLAQLAGDEIDRLLAEAEVEQVTNAPAGAAARPSGADAAFDAALNLAPQLNSDNPAAPAVPQLPAQATLPIVAASIPPAPAPAPVPTLSQQMQQVFASITPTPAPQPFSTTVVSAAPAAKVVDAKVIDTQLATAASALLTRADTEPQPVVVSTADGGTSFAERDGLRAGEIEALTADPLADLQDEEPEASTPLVLKPLEWINAPFAAVPEGVREALGKVAIVTLVNAIGVLAYVLIFRKH